MAPPPTMAMEAGGPGSSHASPPGRTRAPSPGRIGQRTRPAARRDDDVPRFDPLAARVEGDAVRAGEAGGAADERDLVLREQRLNAGDEPGDDLAAAVDRDAEVGGEALVGDAELGPAAEEGQQLGGVEQGLAGDAAPLQAEAAHLVTLDERRAQAELGGANGGDVAAGPGADDCYVVVRHRARDR